MDFGNWTSQVKMTPKLLNDHDFFYCKKKNCYESIVWIYFKGGKDSIKGGESLSN